MAVPMLETAAAGMAEHQMLSDALLVVEPPPHPTTEQHAARSLALCGRPLPPASCLTRSPDTDTPSPPRS